MRLTCAKPAPYGYPVTPQTLGQHIRKRRLDVALLQRELARKLGTDDQTIRNWEADRTKPTHRHMPQVIEFLRYDPFPESANLGEQLRRFRRVHGLTQCQLAKRLGIDPSTLADWETERHRPAERLKGPLEETWRPYLNGRGTRDEALAALVGRVGIAAAAK